MKRRGSLIEKIADIENLQLAFYKAGKGKEHKSDVNAYRDNLDAKLMLLKNELLNCKVNIGNYNFFTIYDPKIREICAASFPERVLHHALMNVCHPFFEQQQIFHSYATRNNKGTYAALDKAKQNQQKYKYYLKLDVRKYFDSINHVTLQKLLRHKFKDNSVLKIFDCIINSYSTASGKGLPIGNLTSQYFANYYLSFADRYLLHELKIPAYVRYMDDMVLWSHNKEELKIKGEKFTKYLKDNLQLNLKTFVLNTNLHGLSFLGYRIFNNKTILNNASKKRFINKQKKYLQNLESHIWSQTEYQNHIIPLIEFTKHAETFCLRKGLFNKDDNQGL